MIVIQWNEMKKKKSKSFLCWSLVCALTHSTSTSHRRAKYFLYWAKASSLPSEKKINSWKHYAIENMHNVQQNLEWGRQGWQKLFRECHSKNQLQPQHCAPMHHILSKINKRKASSFAFHDVAPCSKCVKCTKYECLLKHRFALRRSTCVFTSL